MHSILWYVAVLFLFVPPAFAGDKAVPPQGGQKYLAVFDIEVIGKLDKNIARPLSDSIRREIIRSGSYEVVDRNNMDKILGEQAFQMLSCTQRECAVQAGRLLGVGKIVVGSVSEVGQTYYLSLSLVNVETGKTEQVEQDACKGEIDELLQSSKRVANKLMGGSSIREQGVVKEKSPVTAGLLSILPGVGMYYVGSFGSSGASSWITSRGLLYTTAGLVSAYAGQTEALAGVLIFGIIDSVLSARSYNEYYQQRVRLDLDYDPSARVAALMVRYSF